MQRLILAAAATVLLSACAATPSGQAADVIATTAGQPAPAAAEYVRMAGASDLYEIQSSQIVMESSQNADLRRFAQMMIDHHTRTTAAVMAAALEAGVAPTPPALDAAKAQMIRELQAADGATRDPLYVRQQVMAHREALALHSGYAETGDTPQLMRAAATAVPIVAAHYNAITEMEQGGAPGHAGH